MYTFIAGFILGIVVATVGVSGVAKVLDKGVETVKHEAVKATKD
jgi:hypothetical protein